MNQLMQQLHDIEGLDPISIWPLAIGWWLLIAASACLFIFLIVILCKWIAYKRSWKNDSLKRLSLLDKSLIHQASQEDVALLSEYIRRIALRRFSRKECASLIGTDWLSWLSQHDPKQFDWVDHGKVLIELPYAPANKQADKEGIKLLIRAAKEWVR